MFNLIEQETCPFRITPETIQFGQIRIIPKEEIPPQGWCYAEWQPCHSPFVVCQRGKRGDLCDTWLATLS